MKENEIRPRSEKENEFLFLVQYTICVRVCGEQIEVEWNYRFSSFAAAATAVDDDDNVSTYSNGICTCTY